jgi:peptidoglycan/LPS O-acetylase OafA/YrhL
VDALCAGGLAAILMRRPGNAEPMLAQSGRWTVVTGVLLVALSALCSKMGTGQAGRLVFQLRGTLLALFFVGLVLISLKPATTVLARAFRNPALRFFGKYSYGLYVYHGILTWYFIEKQVEKRLDAALGNHALTMVAYAALGTGISLAVSVASYELFEKRFLKLKRFFEARPAPAEAPRVPSAM